MRKFGLIVGVEEYRDPQIAPLKYAYSDATAIAERLDNRCDFDHLRVLTGERGEDEPTLPNIVTALSDISGELRQEDLFLLFFAGHAIEKDGHGYLLASDSLHAFPEHGSLSLELLRKNFEYLRASKRVVLLDACRNSPDASRSCASNHLSDTISRDIVTTARSGNTSGATTVLMSACSAGQRAYEWPAKKHGVFSYYLIDGLDGSAWEGDTLELTGLARHVSHSVQEWSARTPSLPTPQKPWFEQFGDPDPVLLSKSCALEVSGSERPITTTRSLREACELSGTSDQLLPSSAQIMKMKNVSTHISQIQESDEEKCPEPTIGKSEQLQVEYIGLVIKSLDWQYSYGDKKVMELVELRVWDSVEQYLSNLVLVRSGESFCPDLYVEVNAKVWKIPGCDLWGDWSCLNRKGVGSPSLSFYGVPAVELSATLHSKKKGQLGEVASEAEPKLWAPDPFKAAAKKLGRQMQKKKWAQFEDRE